MPGAETTGVGGESRAHTRQHVLPGVAHPVGGLVSRMNRTVRTARLVVIVESTIVESSRVEWGWGGGRGEGEKGKGKGGEGGEGGVEMGSGRVLKRCRSNEQDQGIVYI